MNIENIINTFASKYKFVLQKDIEYIENLEFDVNNYKNINNKNYIKIFNENIIEIGKLEIIVDKDEDLEFYSIENKPLIYINIQDFLLEQMISECKKHNLI
jgi:hypothetical protein